MNANFAMTLQSGVLGTFSEEFNRILDDWLTLKIVLPHCEDPSQLVGTSLCMHLQSVMTLFS